MGTVGGDFAFPRLRPVRGCWLSPDPADLAAVNPANPQSWNAYAYVANQPLAFTDPLGLGSNASSGCGVGQPADGPCPTFVINVYAYPVFAVNVYAGPAPPAWVGANLAGIPSCSANPDACMIWGLSQHPNLPGPSGGGIGAAITAANPSGLACSEVERDAGTVASGLEKISSGLGWASVGAWVATGVSFFGEAPSFGADSPLTVALGSTAADMTAGAAYAGAAASALRSFASGNLGAIGSFDWSHLIGYATEAAAARIPGLDRLAEAAGGLAEQAASLALAAQEACR